MEFRNTVLKSYRFGILDLSDGDLLRVFVYLPGIDIFRSVISINHRTFELLNASDICSVLNRIWFHCYTDLLKTLRLEDKYVRDQTVNMISFRIIREKELPNFRLMFERKLNWAKRFQEKPFFSIPQRKITPFPSYSSTRNKFNDVEKICTQFRSNLTNAATNIRCESYQVKMSQKVVDGEHEFRVGWNVCVSDYGKTIELIRDDSLVGTFEIASIEKMYDLCLYKNILNAEDYNFLRFDVFGGKVVPEFNIIKRLWESSKNVTRLNVIVCVDSAGIGIGVLKTPEFVLKELADRNTLDILIRSVLIEEFLMTEEGKLEEYWKSNRVDILNKSHDAKGFKLHTKRNSLQEQIATLEFERKGESKQSEEVRKKNEELRKLEIEINSHRVWIATFWKKLNGLRSRLQNPDLSRYRSMKEGNKIIDDLQEFFATEGKLVRSRAFYNIREKASEQIFVTSDKFNDLTVGIPLKLSIDFHPTFRNKFGISLLAGEQAFVVSCPFVSHPDSVKCHEIGGIIRCGDKTEDMKQILPQISKLWDPINRSVIPVQYQFLSTLEIGSSQMELVDFLTKYHILNDHTRKFVNLKKLRVFLLRSGDLSGLEKSFDIRSQVYGAWGKTLRLDRKKIDLNRQLSFTCMERFAHLPYLYAYEMRSSNFSLFCPSIRTLNSPIDWGLHGDMSFINLENQIFPRMGGEENLGLKGKIIQVYSRRNIKLQKCDMKTRRKYLRLNSVDIKRFLRHKQEIRKEISDLFQEKENLMESQLAETYEEYYGLKRRGTMREEKLKVKSEKKARLMCYTKDLREYYSKVVTNLLVVRAYLLKQPKDRKKREYLHDMKDIAEQFFSFEELRDGVIPAFDELWKTIDRYVKQYNLAPVYLNELVRTEVYLLSQWFTVYALNQKTEELFNNLLNQCHKNAQHWGGRVKERTYQDIDGNSVKTNTVLETLVTVMTKLGEKIGRGLFKKQIRRHSYSK